MIELGQFLDLPMEPPLDARVLGINRSPNGKSELLYVDGYFPAFGQINGNGYTGNETVIFRIQDNQGVMQIKVFERLSTLKHIRNRLESDQYRPKIQPQPLPVAA